MIKYLSFAVSVFGCAAAMAFASPATATTVVSCPAAFSASPSLVGCKYVAGNLLGGSPTKVGEQEDAIESLIGLAAGSYTVNWSVVDASKTLFSYANDPSPGSTVDGIVTLSQPLFGQTILAIHFGAGNPVIGNATAFLHFNFAAPTTTFKLTAGEGFSVGGLYQTRTPAVPEPSTWALLILGFGLVGGALRTARKPRPALHYT